MTVGCSSIGWAPLHPHIWVKVRNPSHPINICVNHPPQLFVKKKKPLKKFNSYFDLNLYFNTLIKRKKVHKKEFMTSCNGGEKLNCNGNNTVLLFPTNNAMPLESIIMRFMTLLAENSKTVIFQLKTSISVL